MLEGGGVERGGGGAMGSAWEWEMQWRRGEGRVMLSWPGGSCISSPSSLQVTSEVLRLDGTAPVLG